MLEVGDYLSHTFPVQRTMSRMQASPTCLLQTVAQRGCFRDVFGQCILLRASLFKEDNMQDVAIDLVPGVCGIARTSALSMYQDINMLLPCEPRDHTSFDFSRLPAPFDKLIGTLTGCVVMLKCLNCCGPTEADIFRKLHQGGSLIDVLEDNNLLPKDTEGCYLWKDLIVQHFYKDMQF